MTIKDYPKMQILCVSDDFDDNQDLDRTLNYIYRLKGEFNVLWAEDGQEALKYTNSKFDLIILDFYLEDMSGYELYIKLQEYECTKDVPVIFKTDMGRIQKKLRFLLDRDINGKFQVSLSFIPKKIKELFKAKKAEIIFAPYSRYVLTETINNIMFKLPVKIWDTILIKNDQ